MFRLVSKQSFKPMGVHYRLQVRRAISSTTPRCNTDDDSNGQSTGSADGPIHPPWESRLLLPHSWLSERDEIGDDAKFDKMDAKIDANFDKLNTKMDRIRQEDVLQRLRLLLDLEEAVEIRRLLRHGKRGAVHPFEKIDD
ncbi:hypothetical protein FN846DRAFT_903278 [Sphaerosporella brunnea]|uniref:Uncharacterized protein n=1 Tax=Sphaerosporella brunnea TaxID=1250544 RepID=A0A5J5F7I8_9PEZI|nr:hypothetical protein FN846DRAFT_903278 [Sphaerosporella brunnea]